MISDAIYEQHTSGIFIQPSIVDFDNILNGCRYSPANIFMLFFLYQPNAQTASSKYCVFVAPIIGNKMPFAHCHAMAIWDILQLYFSASSDTRFTIFISSVSVVSYFPLATRSVVPRRESDFHCASCQMPAARGLYGIRKTFICLQIGISSGSSSL